MPAPLRVLILEDSATDVAVVVEEVRQAGYEPIWHHVETRAQFAAALGEEYDLVLSDFGLPEFNGLQALELLRGRRADTPFILVSGSIGEETAFELVRKGAADYVPKAHLDRLGRAVTRALRERAAEREKVLAQEALRASEERFRAMVENVQDIITVLDASGRVRWVTPSVERVLGYGVTEVTGRDAFVWLHSEDAGAAREAFSLADSGGGFSDPVEFRVQHRDGRWLWFEVLGRNLLELPSVTGLVLVWRDITRRRRSEEERERMATNWLLLLESTDEGIYGVDRQGCCTFMNTAAARLLGWIPADALGKDMHDLIHHSRSPGVPYPVAECPIYRAFLEGQPCRVSNEFFWRRDGTPFAVSYASHPIVEAGETIGAVVTFSDITGRKELEAKFLRAQRIESIGSLAGGIAHDLNNILAPITMATQVLQLQHSDRESLSLLGTIEQSARRGAEIVRQVLTFARGGDGDRLLIQPRHFLKELARLAKETFPKTILINRHLAEDLWTVIGDPAQLRQVLMNLCVNARDAMPGGGSLWLSGHNRVIDDYEASLLPDARPGRYVVLQVKDTGIGIPPAILHKIFDPFFTTKQQGKGAGLGLSSSLGIVRSHGGFIQVSSVIGEGTTFSVFLPASPDAAEAPASERPKVVLPLGHGETVLVVDDEAGVRDVTRELLVRHGYEVLVAEDGTEAIAMFADRRDVIRLVITDIVMPFMDGVALVRALRKMDRDLKVVIMSGLVGAFDQGDRAMELRSLDVAAFLQKPFNAELLLTTVRDALHGAR